MDVYAFTERTARKLQAAVERLQRQVWNLERYQGRNLQRPDDGTRNYICQTPSGGIAARSGSTVSSATCDVYYIDGSTLTSAGFSIDVHNLSATAVAGSTYIATNKCHLSGKHYAVFEDCT